jgi:hypothetical protein
MDPEAFSSPAESEAVAYTPTQAKRTGRLAMRLANARSSVTGDTKVAESVKKTTLAAARGAGVAKKTGFMNRKTSFDKEGAHRLVTGEKNFKEAGVLAAAEAAPHAMKLAFRVGRAALRGFMRPPAEAAPPAANFAPEMPASGFQAGFAAGPEVPQARAHAPALPVGGPRR